MKYYSKSPKEYQEERLEAGEEQKRVWTRGRIILVIDIVIVVLILFFYQSSTRKLEAPVSLKKFQIEGALVEGRCESSTGECLLEVSFPPGKRAQGQCQWVVRDSSGGLIVQETKAWMVLAEPEDASGTPNGDLARGAAVFSKFMIPGGLLERDEEFTITVGLLDAAGNEKASFGVYP